MPVHCDIRELTSQTASRNRLPTNNAVYNLVLWVMLSGECLPSLCGCFLGFNSKHGIHLGSLFFPLPSAIHSKLNTSPLCFALPRPFCPPSCSFPVSIFSSHRAGEVSKSQRLFSALFYQRALKSKGCFLFGTEFLGFSLQVDAGSQNPAGAPRKSFAPMLSGKGLRSAQTHS